MNLARIERAVDQDHENFENLDSWKENDLFASDIAQTVSTGRY